VFALITVFTLALGIGANTANLLSGECRHPSAARLPRPELWSTSQPVPALGFDQFWISPPEFVELQEADEVLLGRRRVHDWTGELDDAGPPRRVNLASGTTELFTALGVAPWRGRTFEESGDAPNGPMAAMLSYELWRSAFGGDESVVGSLVEIGGVRRPIVGIMPPRFDVADSHAEILGCRW